MFRGLSSVEAMLGAALFAQSSFGQFGGEPLNQTILEVSVAGEEQLDPEEKNRTGPLEKG